MILHPLNWSGLSRHNQESPVEEEHAPLLQDFSLFYGVVQWPRTALFIGIQLYSATTKRLLKFIFLKSLLILTILIIVYISCETLKLSKLSKHFMETGYIAKLRNMVPSNALVELFKLFLATFKQILLSLHCPFNQRFSFLDNGLDILCYSSLYIVQILGKTSECFASGLLPV